MVVRLIRAVVVALVDMLPPQTFLLQQERNIPYLLAVAERQTQLELMLLEMPDLHLL